ncbi:hypothetical protein ACFV7R_30705 [Streptomyces sp. NPDC059866]|uniref:hypothetical protein n=1 Tax=Streptomyces sp. NPDC059866 TaxID=3346978 RepID=UPI0036676AF6
MTRQGPRPARPTPSTTTAQRRRAARPRRKIWPIRPKQPLHSGPDGKGGGIKRIPAFDGFIDFPTHPGEEIPGSIPWWVVADDLLGDLFNTPGLREGETSLDDRIAGVRERLTRLVNGDEAGVQGTSDLLVDLNIDAATARTLNSALDLSNPSALTEFVAEFTRAAAGRANTTRLLGA